MPDLSEITINDITYAFADAIDSDPGVQAVDLSGGEYAMLTQEEKMNGTVYFIASHLFALKAFQSDGNPFRANTQLIPDGSEYNEVTLESGVYAVFIYDMSTSWHWLYALNDHEFEEGSYSFISYRTDSLGPVKPENEFADFTAVTYNNKTYDLLKFHWDNGTPVTAANTWRTKTLPSDEEVTEALAILYEQASS